MSRELSRHQVPTIDWLAVLGLLMMTRLSWVPLYLGIDRVNMAYALDEFNPATHQPQPPGYPLSVFFARLIDSLVHDPHTTFLIISIGISALSLPVLFMLASRMFSKSEARVAVFLLVLNPVLWSASLRSPLRPHLALFSLLIAYCCWRCIQGENRFVLWGALALGVGGGFRPDIIIYMSPLWVVSTWLGTRSLASLCRGALVFGFSTLVWLVPTSMAAGGPGAYFDVIVSYFAQQSEGESILLGASWQPWLHQMSRLVAWNGLAVAGWLIAVPIFLRAEGRIRLRSMKAGFIAAWVIPGILVQAFTHVAAPGHTLFSVAALCLLGGHVLHCAILRIAGAGRYHVVCQIALAAVLAFDAMIFLNVFPQPAPVMAESSGPLRGLSSVRNALVYGAFETSRDQIMWVDDITHTSLKEIDAFTPRDRPSIIVSVEGNDEEFNFLNWRIASYYLPEREISVLVDDSQKRWTRVVRGPHIVEKQGDDATRIAVPTNARILWLMERDTRSARELSKILPLKKGRYVSYTDVPPDLRVFNFRNFTFAVN